MQNMQRWAGALGLELRTAALHKDGIGYKKIAKNLKTELQHDGHDHTAV